METVVEFYAYARDSPARVCSTCGELSADDLLLVCADQASFVVHRRCLLSYCSAGPSHLGGLAPDRLRQIVMFEFDIDVGGQRAVEVLKRIFPARFVSVSLDELLFVLRDHDTSA